MDDDLSNFFHGLSHLAASSAQAQIGLFLAHFQFSLEDPFRPLDNFARREFIGELRALFFEAGHLNLGAHEKADRGEQSNLTPCIRMRQAMLQIDYSDERALAPEWAPIGRLHSGLREVR
jgi:hypothetical protein